MSVSVLTVADRAGVSVSTVSRALRGVPGISAVTRKRVQEAADELGYVVSPSASRLATGRTRTIAVVVPLLSKWFFAEVIAAAGRVLSREGYDVLLTELSTPELRAEFFGSPRLHGRSDGALVVALQLTPEELATLGAQGQAVALVGSERAGASSVRVEDRIGGLAATRHLLNLGHERIAFLGIQESPGSPLGGVPPAERLLGYRDALAEAGLPADPALELGVENTVDDGVAAMASLLTMADPPTAVVAASDELAFGALSTLRGAGLDVPADFSVVGYDNHEFARVVGLTTIDHSVADQGRLAAEALVASLAGQPAAVGRIEPRLVVRGSTAPPRRLRVGS
ncbi:LacI family DNA-binding transcriptional regulator [Sinomonas sp. ASV322]|uniref:LacI family DNA-binding transcriptional regulator n=1 Tax=Sinomonas sp. ASV322 TaxID=3041920 RepID=UPI0027DB9A03|nr:LacI family DNA-binding transcriptional regulator [Sinomonas sp. ASV322]MDQ4503526.1 LacI family DNA-binding transcriptional regulator [Sinomonas sp. ASV322]